MASTRNLDQLNAIANACNANCDGLDTNGEILDNLAMLAEAGQLSGDGTIVVDSALDETSVAPVQNRVIAKLIPAEANSGNRLADKAYVDTGLAGKADADHTHDNSALEAVIDSKVDKIEGKGLSTEDFTTAEKERLASLHNYDDSELREQIVGISNKIPIEANEENQLADKAYVKSEIDEKLVELADKEGSLVGKESSIVDYFNPETITIGYFIQDGELVESEDWSVTDFIPCQVGDIIHGNCSNRHKHNQMIILYDKDKNYLEGMLDDSLQDMTSGKCVVTNTEAAYFRMCFCHHWFGTDRKFNFAVVERYRNPTDEIKIIVDSNADNSENLICSSFWKALSLAYTLGNCTIVVKEGVYNLYDDLTTAYMNEVCSQGYVGLFIGRNVKVIGENQPTIKFINPRSDINTDNFSIMNVTGSFRLEGLNIIAQNIRYCVHEDMPTYKSLLDEIGEYPQSYVAEYINCNMSHLGVVSTTYTANCCIGAGTSYGSKSIIDGGTYYSVGYEAPISYHNHGLSGAGSMTEEVYISNVNITNSNYLQGYGMVSAGSTVKFFLRNNKMNRGFHIAGDASKLVIDEFNCGTDAEITNYAFEYTGKRFNGKPIYSVYCIYLICPEWTFNSTTNLWEAANLEIKSFTENIEQVFDVRVWTTGNNYLYYQPHADKFRLYPSVEKLDGITKILVSGWAEYQYGGNNGLPFNVYMEFTLGD